MNTSSNKDSPNTYCTLITIAGHDSLHLQGAIYEEPTFYLVSLLEVRKLKQKSAPF